MVRCFSMSLLTFCANHSHCKRSALKHPPAAYNKNKKNLPSHQAGDVLPLYNQPVMALLPHTSPPYLLESQVKPPGGTMMGGGVWMLNIRLESAAYNKVQCGEWLCLYVYVCVFSSSRQEIMWACGFFFFCILCTERYLNFQPNVSFLKTNHLRAVLITSKANPFFSLLHFTVYIFCEMSHFRAKCELKILKSSILLLKNM